VSFLRLYLPYSIQKVRYQSLTKTRKYVYEGKVVTRQTTKVIVSGTENLEQEERAVRCVVYSVVAVSKDNCSDM
jgi:hypothetical protein